jgi:hypothetical protein
LKDTKQTLFSPDVTLHHEKKSQIKGAGLGGGTEGGREREELKKFLYV